MYDSYMEKVTSSPLSQLPATHLASKAVRWWCPERASGVRSLASRLSHARAAARDGDWGEYWVTLNKAACSSSLGYDTEAQEEELLAFLDDLCRGYRD
jgi:hypothetical protein